MEHINYVAQYHLEVTLLASLEPPIAYQKVYNAIFMAQKWATDNRLAIAVWVHEARGYFGVDDYIVRVPLTIEDPECKLQPPGQVRLDDHIQMVRYGFTNSPDPITTAVIIANVRMRDRVIDGLNAQIAILEKEDSDE